MEKENPRTSLKFRDLHRFAFLKSGATRKSSTSIEWQVKGNMRILTFEDTKNGIFANDTVRSADMAVKQLQKGDGAWDSGSFEVTVPDKKLKRR